MEIVGEEGKGPLRQYFQNNIDLSYEAILAGLHHLEFRLLRRALETESLIDQIDLIHLHVVKTLRLTVKSVPGHDVVQGLLELSA